VPRPRLGPAGLHVLPDLRVVVHQRRAHAARGPVTARTLDLGAGRCRYAGSRSRSRWLTTVETPSPRIVTP
jgi:hypothetical protein